MKLSSKGRHALLMLLDLAERRDTGYISLKEIAERQGISKKYLEQIAPILHKNGFLKTNRGFQGGYMLAQAPDKYPIGAILCLTEDYLAPTQPEEEGATSFLLRELDQVIRGYLGSVTLQDVLDRQRERYGNDYII